MARLRFADVIRNIDLVVFDKDGTLIDFDFTWSRRCERAVDALIAERPERAAARSVLLATIGVDPATGRAIAESPLVVGSLAEATIVAATVLYQRGETWTEATSSAERTLKPFFASAPAADELRTLGDVAGLFARLRAAGVAVGVLTNDDRLGTEATLSHLGLARHVTALGCADDRHGAKPEPHGLVALAGAAGVPLARVAMVGDAIGDLVTARRAGAALAVAVLSGVADHTILAPYADVVIDAVTAIEVIGG
ncbi:MAG: HAD family hydrolase [Ancalomicrobiaceae bacterium]|nr:HAD family hydrolase [Ancalomicrobiaceae bacterium]